MLSLALIGCGRHSGQHHAPALAHYAAAHPGVIELAAVCDLARPRAEAFAREYGFAAAYDDVESMLAAESLAGCVCVMPIPAIVPLASLLLTRGMPCSIEKPPADSRAAARRLLEVARTTGGRHQVSVNRRFMPGLQRARELAAGWGPLRAIRGTMLRCRRTEVDFIWGTGLHAVDAMRCLGGELTAWHGHSRGQPSWTTVHFDFAGGCTGDLAVLPTTGRVSEQYELYGEDYSVVFSHRLDLGATVLQAWHEGRQVAEETDSDSPQFMIEGAYHETCNFIDSLQSGRWSPTLAEVMPSLDICFDLFEQQP